MRNRMRRCASLLGLAILVIGFVASTAADVTTTEPPTAEDLISAFNERSLADPAWRRVSLDLLNGDSVARSFTVVNLWRRQGEAVSTLFVLEEPASLRGTNYLLTERPAEDQDMRVHLHLPAGKRRVLEINPSRFDEGLLGSDFSYRDLRMQIPTGGFSFRLRGPDELLGRKVWRVEAIAGEERRDPWARSVFYLSEGPVLLLGIDRFRDRGDVRPTKRLRVEGLKQVDGAWTETRIVMTASDGRWSRLSLSSFRPHLTSLAGDLFEPKALAQALERLPSDGEARDAAARDAGTPDAESRVTAQGAGR